MVVMLFDRELPQRLLLNDLKSRSFKENKKVINFNHLFSAVSNVRNNRAKSKGYDRLLMLLYIYVPTL